MKNSLLPLSTEALNHVSQFKPLTTNDKFESLERFIQSLDTNLRGFGFTAIQAKVKLNDMKELTEVGFQIAIRFLN